MDDDLAQFRRLLLSGSLIVLTSIACLAIWLQVLWPYVEDARIGRRLST